MGARSKLHTTSPPRSIPYTVLDPLEGRRGCWQSRAYISAISEVHEATLGRLTVQTKHSLCHFAPIALTAMSGIGKEQPLHLGL
jgi:hypothetical protein